MAEEPTPHDSSDEREDDRLRDIWLFTLFALGVLIFALFTAPRGCGEALQERNSGTTKVIRSGEQAPAATRSTERRSSVVPGR
ncbi:MAG TPA: hypothetical protein VNN62_17130 [Methylomirabilota bacterium]|nr:hypothetical protein [Methylomirabilota bacterium]